MSIIPGADMEGTPFDDAFDLLGDVDESLLIEYEDDLWEHEKRKIIFATKHVSVIDCVTDLGGCMRLLLRNTEPLLVQTPVPVDDVGASILPVPALPPLFGQYGSHVGGLVLAIALWRAQRIQEGSHAMRPRVVVLGGGGGAVPRAISKALPDASIDVVELCADTQVAARTCFGLEELERCRDAFRLHTGCGAEYLMSVAEDSVDVLIIDAASHNDGGLHAPPSVFRSIEFWKAARRAMNTASATFGLNLVGHGEAVTSLQRDILNLFDEWSFRLVPPPPGGLPDALELDHYLLFGASSYCADGAELEHVGFQDLNFALIDKQATWLEHWDKHPILRKTRT